MSCEGCLYWKSLDSRDCGAVKCCHYILKNYKRRPRAKDGSCLGYTPADEHQERTICKKWNALWEPKKGETK